MKLFIFVIVKLLFLLYYYPLKSEICSSVPASNCVCRKNKMNLKKNM